MHNVSIAAPRLTLARLWLPQVGLRFDALRVLLGSAAISLAAQWGVAIPGTPVPLTGQTLGVLLVGAVLGSRLGSLAVLAYLAEGAAGLPVWAPGGAPGLASLLGPTGGYLAGFVVAAALVGWLSERGWDRGPMRTMAAMVLGNAAIYAFGLAGLSRFVPGTELLTQGLWPFLPGDGIKLLIASAALPAARALTLHHRAASQPPPHRP